MTAVFWICIFLVVYTYFLYPLLLRLLTPKTTHQAIQPIETWPSVDVLISAFNEESCIAERIENLLKADYLGVMNICVASDGSSDGTAEILERYQQQMNIKVSIHQQNRGKVTVLNELVANSHADFVVFTDANTEFQNDTISRLITAFTPSVGAVCGELHLYNPEGNDNSDSLYWRYEQFLKKSESNLGALLGANGAVYAIRRELYIALPISTVVDDFCIVMNVKRQGFDVIYEEAAEAREEVAPTLMDEYGRRVRIGLGNYRAFLANFWALSPTMGVLSWCYWSHKVLRWFAPHCLLIVFILNGFLISVHPGYAVIAGLQIAFYALALYGSYRAREGHKINSIVAIVSFFVSMNVALAHGFVKFLFGGKQGSWKRTAR